MDLLEILGKGYVIEHCVSFFHKRQEERLFRNYLTDAIRIITYNTSKQGSGIMEQRYSEILESMKKPKDSRTPEEVINKISDKLKRMSEE